LCPIVLVQVVGLKGEVNAIPEVGRQTSFHLPFAFVERLKIGVEEY